MTVPVLALVRRNTSNIGNAVRQLTIGGDDLKHAIVDGEDGHIERATAQVKHQDVLLAASLVQA